ncbi:hypothetical protein [Halovivax asiaticus]|uniref:hypothetical protein n=1 Tax=Halovivax asiaticus TaxID=332953 RepID=UPI00126738A2|nr:hypothetical protein [Halovivax asiaticus]
MSPPAFPRVVTTALRAGSLPANGFLQYFFKQPAGRESGRRNTAAGRTGEGQAFLSTCTASKAVGRASGPKTDPE